LLFELVGQHELLHNIELTPTWFVTNQQQKITVSYAKENFYLSNLILRKSYREIVHKSLNKMITNGEFSRIQIKFT
jgi:hypothetical protein